MVQRSTVSLQDIADLAQVRRHAVSMWRRRPRARGQNLPFPEPVTSPENPARFDRDEIVGWLERTGRGNNAEVRQDAPAVAAPEGVDVEDVVTLLCLHVLTGAELDGLTAAQLVGIAERADPDDRLLLREVQAAADVPHLLPYVDDLVEASYGALDALTRVEAGRLRRKAAERGLTDGLVELVHAVAAAARVHLQDDEVALVPPADCRLTRKLVEGFAGVVLADDRPARARRRRAVIDGIDVLEGAPATVRVLSVVGEPEAEALEAVDDVVVSLGPTDVGVILGPAALLCDSLVGVPEQRRAQTLRPGNLVMAVRLPRGLWKAAHRQSLALWVLHGSDARSLWLADLDTETIDLDDLASDVTAALQRTGDRAYRYARRGELAPILAGGPVVPRGVRALRLARGDRVNHLDRVHRATLITSEPVLGYDVTVAPATGQIVLRRRSLAELADPHRSGRRQLRRGADRGPDRRSRGVPGLRRLRGAALRPLVVPGRERQGQAGRRQRTGQDDRISDRRGHGRADERQPHPARHAAAALQQGQPRPAPPRRADRPVQQCPLQPPG